MIRFSRMLATRLRRLAFPATRPLGASRPLGAPGARDVWSRFQHALLTSDSSRDDVRRRELMEENLRLAITLLGQRRRVALARVLAACDGELRDAGLAIRIALALAGRQGNDAVHG